MIAGESFEISRFPEWKLENQSDVVALALELVVLFLLLIVPHNKKMTADSATTPILHLISRARDFLFACKSEAQNQKIIVVSPQRSALQQNPFFFPFSGTETFNWSILSTARRTVGARLRGFNMKCLYINQERSMPCVSSAHSIGQVIVPLEQSCSGPASIFITTKFHRHFDASLSILSRRLNVSQNSIKLSSARNHGRSRC